MAAFIFYWFGLFVLLAGLMCIKREEEEEIFTGVTLAVIVGMSVQTLIMGIFQILHLPVNCFSVGTVGIILGTALLYDAKKNNRKQKYVFNKRDGLAQLLFLCLVLAWGIGRFGGGLDWFHYETTDPGKHVVEALHVSNNQEVLGMYYAQGLVGLFHQSLSVFPGISAFRIAIVFELFALYLVISSFWSIIKKYVTTWGSLFVAFILSCLYFFGYPICGEIFGSQYLVCGVALVTTCLTVFNKYFFDIWDKKTSIIVLMILTNGLAVCYAQFCPVVFGAIGIGIIVKEKKLKKIIITGLSVFLLPCINAVFFILIGALGGLGISGGLALEGYIYRDLYSDFLLILPFALVKLCLDWKGKKFSIDWLGFLLTVIWVLAFFAGVLFGRIQGYYYYKNYYLLWTFVWILGSSAILLKWQEMKFYMLSFSVVWGSMIFLHFTGTDMYLCENYFVINQSMKSGDLFGIYSWNRDHYANDGIVSRDVQELYKKAGDLADETGTYIPVMCPRGGFVFSYYAITEQMEYEPYIFEFCGMDYFWNQVQECEYLTVWHGIENEAYMQHIGSWERVYENEAGYIAKVDKVMDAYAELEGIYGKEGTGANTIRWAQKEGKITYINDSDADIEKEVSFEIIGAGNIKEDSSVIITTGGKEETYVFEGGAIRYNMKLLIPANSRESISWVANVEPVSLEAGRELYIAFRGYDSKWDMQEK